MFVINDHGYLHQSKDWLNFSVMQKEKEKGKKKSKHKKWGKSKKGLFSMMADKEMQLVLRVVSG